MKLLPQTEKAYHDRWNEWSARVRLSMNGDRNPERIAGYRMRHYDRLVRLNQGLGIPMAIIGKYSMDDPRITEPEMMIRITKYKKGKNAHKP